MRYNFEWDPVKSKRNIRKRKISFQRAATIFRDPYMISLFDDEHSQEEDRWITIGRDSNGILLVVSHTFREADTSLCYIRIISARKATKQERKQYEE
ncbi:BrnT family toxin [Desulfobacterales bacterium HSG2]|nr:BrnT family toxin [Desulfobacterales bacterium HSG2]